MHPNDILKLYNDANDLFYNKRIHDESVLKLYDRLISYGFEKAYCERAFLLQRMGYYFDSIADFDKGITTFENDPNLYYGRSISKKAVFDFDGSINDLGKAIRLAELDLPENDELVNKIKSLGWDSLILFYKTNMRQDLSDYKYYLDNPDILEDIKQKSKIKMRSN